VVSRAFQILSDSDKKSRYDKFGGDPDSRFNPGPSASSGGTPFSGFSGGGFPRGGGAGQGFEAEMSPEEMFNRFFNGGFGGMGNGFGPFGTLPFARTAPYVQD
jgi:DnaJ homolog subfamily B member 12